MTNKMIKLFITDLDGCISHPFQSPPWDVLTEIRYLNQKSEFEKEIPPLSICSGRPLPYVEAVAQWLDIRVPVVFESAGLYFLEENRVDTNSAFTPEDGQSVRELQKWLSGEIVPLHEGLMVELSKMMDAGIVHPEQKVIDGLLPVISRHVKKNYPRFEVHNTSVSVNIVLKNNNKKAGIGHLCKEMGIEPAEVAYIGDTSGDVPALKIVGRAFSPSNARKEVRAVTEQVPEDSTRAVLETYKRVIEENRRLQ